MTRSHVRCCENLKSLAKWDDGKNHMPTLYIDSEKDRAAREAYLQLAAAADRFEQYANPHAVRIAAIAEALAEAFHMAAQDRKSLRTAAYMHDLGEVAMER